MYTYLIVILATILTISGFFPNHLSALTTADLPGSGETLAVESDDTVFIAVDETATLSGTLRVQGTTDTRPTLTIENHGEFVLNDATLSAERAALVIVNTATGVIRNTLDGSQDFEALDAGGITIVNVGTLNFTYTEGSTGGTTFTAQKTGGEIQITNSGSIAVGNAWNINCSNNGTFKFSQQEGSLKINHLFAQVSSSTDDTDALKLTFAGGTVEANRLDLQAEAASIHIENAADCLANNITFTLTDSWQGGTLLNNGDLQITDLTINAYGAGFLFDNRATLEISNTSLKSQNDTAGPYPALTIENRGDATLSNYNATANGASGLVRLVNHTQLYAGNQNLDGNYGGTIQFCSLDGSVTSNNVTVAAGGASHGKASQVDLTSAGGTMIFNNFYIVNGSYGIAKLLNMAEALINNATISLTDGGIAQLASQAGSLAFNNVNATVTGQAEDDGTLSALTIWNTAVLTMKVINTECNESGTFIVPAFEAGKVYTFRADCTGATDGLAFAASVPQPSAGASDVEVASVGLSWSGGDPDGDAVTYDLYLVPDTGDTCLLCNRATATGLIEPAYTVGDLDPGTTYAWQVATYSGLAAGVPGPVWSFTTRDEAVTPEEEIATDDDDNDGHCFCFIATARI